MTEQQGGSNVEEPAVSGARRRARLNMAKWCMAIITAVITLAAAGFIPPEHHEIVLNLCWIPGAVIIAFYGGDAGDSFAQAVKARK